MIIPKHLSKLLDIEYPIVQAPMAGGYISTELIAAIVNAGGLGSIAAGYLRPEELREKIKEVRVFTSRPFQVNLFIPHNSKINTEDIETFIQKATQFNPEIDTNKTIHLYNEKLWKTTDLDEMVDVIIDENIPIVSFTFGVPSDEIIERLRAHGILIIGSATHLLEAYMWQEKGADALVLQGSEAGGHRAGFIGNPIKVAQSSLTLLQQGTRELSIPIISAGGYFDAKSMGAAFCLGASAISIGTAFLTTHEINTAEEHKDLIINSNELDTTLTQHLSGAWARTIRTEGLKALEGSDLPLLPFPAHSYILNDLLNQKSFGQYSAVYAGVNAQFCEKISASTLMSRWITELQCL